MRLELSAKVDATSAKVDATSAKVDATSVEVEALRRLQEADDLKSWASPTGKQYEEYVDSKIDAWLADECGLEVLGDSRRSIPKSDDASGGFQWDARFSVTCSSSWEQPPSSSLLFAYGGRYSRPSPVARRRLSPLKPLLAEYFTVLEYTRFPGWTRTWTADSAHVRKSLLPRLEERLLRCIQRAQAAGVTSTGICDLVALVGVVGEDACKESVEELLSDAKCVYINLRQLFLAHRFVFFQCTLVLPTGPAVFVSGGVSVVDGLE